MQIEGHIKVQKEVYLILKRLPHKQYKDLQSIITSNK